MRLGIVLSAVALILGGCHGELAQVPEASDTTESALGPTPTPTPTDTLPNLCPTSGRPAARGTTALPALTLHCLGSSRTVKLRELAGKPMVLNFWASWCGPCKVELPLLARAHREFGSQIAFVGVDVTDASAPAWSVLTTAGVTYPQLEDPRGRTRGPFRWNGGLPMTVFVDERGRMVGTERTSFRTYAEVTAAIHRHVGPVDGLGGRGDE